MKKEVKREKDFSEKLNFYYQSNAPDISFITLSVLLFIKFSCHMGKSRGFAACVGCAFGMCGGGMRKSGALRGLQSFRASGGTQTRAERAEGWKVPIRGAMAILCMERARVGFCGCLWWLEVGCWS